MHIGQLDAYAEECLSFLRRKANKLSTYNFFLSKALGTNVDFASPQIVPLID